MALIHRISRLFTADLHAVLDRIEDPEVLLRQSVREMEDACVAGELRLKKLEAEAVRVAEIESKLREALAVLDGELDVCFAAGKDALARSVVRKKLLAERRLERVAVQRDGLDATVRTLAERLAEERQQLEEVRQKAELLTATPAPGGWPDAAPEPAVTDAEVDVALLREAQKRSAS